MKKILATLILVLGFAFTANAQDEATYFPEFIEKSPAGYYYLSSNREHVFVCGGHYITSNLNPKVTCLSKAMQSLIDTLIPKSAVYYERIAKLAELE